MGFSFKYNASTTQYLEGIENGVGKAVGPALYKAAGIVADAVSAAIQGIRTEPFHFVKEGERKRLASPQEKAALGQGKFGIAKWKKNGAEITTAIGMSNSGYAEIKGAGKNSKGKTVPVPVIARSIDSGTSFMQKQPFLRNALKKAGGEAISVMSAEIDKRFQDLVKGR